MYFLHALHLGPGGQRRTATTLVGAAVGMAELLKGEPEDLEGEDQWGDADDWPAVFEGKEVHNDPP